MVENTESPAEQVARSFGARGGIPAGSSGRLLGAIGAARYDSPSTAFAALKTLPDISSVRIQHEEYTVFRDTGADTKMGWTITVISKATKANAHLERDASLHAATCRILESYRKNPLGTDPLDELATDLDRIWSDAREKMNAVAAPKPSQPVTADRDNHYPNSEMDGGFGPTGGIGPEGGVEA
jgi:hypothetical protein